MKLYGVRVIRCVFQVCLMITCSSFHGYSVTIWSEDFATYALNATLATDINNPPVGADWSVTGNCKVKNTARSIRVQNSSGTWTSEVIDITSYTAVMLSASHRQVGSMGSADVAQTQYQLNGTGGWIDFTTNGNINGSFGTLTSSEFIGTGTTVQIKVTLTCDGSSGTEKLFLDDVLLEDLTCDPCYSVASGDISDASIWASTSGGTAGKAPTASGGVGEPAYIIEGGFTVDVNQDVRVDSVIVGTTAGSGSGAGILRWTGNYVMEINNDGQGAACLIYVENGSSIQRNGFDAEIEFSTDNDGAETYTVTINDAAVGISIEKMEVLGDDATITFGGAGILTLSDELEVDEDRSDITNNLTGVFTVNDDIRLSSGDDDDCVFTNNGTIVIGDDLMFEDDDDDGLFTNNGTVTVGDDLYFNNAGNRSVYTNAAGATTNINGKVHFESTSTNRAFVINNLGVFNVSEIIDIQTDGTTLNNAHADAKFTVTGNVVFGNDDLVINNSVGGGEFITNDFNTEDGQNNDRITLTNVGTMNFVNFDTSGENDYTFNNTGTVNMTGNFDDFLANQNTFTNDNNGTWNWSGSSYDSDLRLYCSASGNTFNYNRSGNQGMIEVQGNDYHHLEITESGTKTSVGDMDIEGNLLISGTAEFDVNTGNDDITLAGNWVNTSSVGFDQTNQKVTFDGTGAQSITCSTLGTETFHDLNINKSSGGTVILNNHVDLTDQMNFNGSHGYMSIGVYNLTINNWDNGDFIGYDENEFVVVDNTGLIQFSGVADGDVVNLPMGIGIGSANYALTDVTLTDAGDGDFSGNLCNQVQADGGCGGTALSDYALGLTWNLNSTSNDATVKLYWDTSQELTSFDNTDCFVSLYSGGSWRELSAGSVAINEGGSLRSQSGSTTSFSSFSVGSSGGVLPIELWYFEVLVVGEHVLLKWSTAAEINNDYFTIERSADGVLWEEIGVVVGAGNSFTPLYYHFTDQFPIEGSSYYRLKQTDFDNKQQHYQKQEVFQEGFAAVASSAFQVELYPNPVQGDQFFIKLLIGDPEQRILLTVYDAYGKQIQAQDLNQTKGQDLHAIRLADQVLAGMYFVVLRCKERAITKKIVVKR